MQKVLNSRSRSLSEYDPLNLCVNYHKLKYVYSFLWREERISSTEVIPLIILYILSASRCRWQCSPHSRPLIPTVYQQTTTAVISTTVNFFFFSPCGFVVMALGRIWQNHFVNCKSWTVSLQPEFFVMCFDFHLFVIGRHHHYYCLSSTVYISSTPFNITNIHHIA